MAGVVVVFDFDKTIIDCDSDNFVVDEFGGTELFDDLLLQNIPWNYAIDKMMAEFHSKGRTVEEIASCLRRASLPANTAAAIKAAYALGCELRIVSDANTFFIGTILEHHGLLGCFSQINTNPGYVDEEGRLRIFPYHDFSNSSHGCNLCPPNMCKGKIIDRILDESDGKKRIIYLGDGKGDYCPSLRLRKEDYMMPRKNYPVWKLIAANPECLVAQVREWCNAEDLERILFQLINDCILADQNSGTAGDCQLQVLPLPGHEELPATICFPALTNQPCLS